MIADALRSAPSVADVDALIRLFDDLFAQSEGTRLVRGDTEPVYRPRDAQQPYDQIIFAHGFFASALHEVAHWCIAGRQRRQLPDFGYWYAPDGRSATEQRHFEQVETKPQALEWIFATAARTPFNFSADNLSPGGAIITPAWRLFQERVATEARAYLTRGLPPRAERFAEALASRFGIPDAWRDVSCYHI